MQGREGGRGGWRMARGKAYLYYAKATLERADKAHC
jgi:hypothetical protein